jgi:DHA1 family multidrug resistance protein-like MFS transporter
MLFKNRQIAILFAGLAVVMLGFGIIIPILPLYARQLGASSLHLGLIMAVFSFFQFIFAPIWGSISDRIGRKPVLLIGLVGYALAHIINGFASSVAMLLVSRAVGGILSSAVLPTSLAYVSDVTAEKDRGGGMGILGAAMGTGVIFGPSLGGLVAHFTNSYHIPFFVAAELVHALGSELALYFVLAFMVSFAAANLEGIFAYFAFDRFACGPKEMGVIFTIIGVVSVIMQGVLVGPAINRLGENKLILVGLAVTGAGFVLLTRSWNFVSLTAFVVLNMAGGALLRPSISSIISKRTTAGQGTTMGIVGSFDSLGRIVGPVLAGFLYHYSINLPYYVGGAVMLLGIVVAVPAMRSARRAS